MKQKQKILSETELTSQTDAEQSVAKKKREELMAVCKPKDPSEEIVIEMIASSYAQWKEIESSRLGTTRSVFGFEVEAKVKHLAARNLKEMIFALRELQRTPMPPIQIRHAEKIQVAVLEKGV